MGNSTNDTFIVWIDKNVNSKKNKEYQKTIESYENITFKCFEEVEKGIEYIKQIKFQKTIIITSGRLYPEFYHSLKACEYELYIIPKIIIFTGNAKTFYSQIDKSLPIDDSFYNIGKVVDNIENVKKFIEKSINNYNCEFKENEEKRIKDENLIFQTISDKNELIVPIFYSKYLINTTKEQIYNFNNTVLNNNDNDEIIQFLFSQLVEAKNIPNNILIKFWLRAYSTNGSFNEIINKKLSEKKYKDYLHFIQKLYEEANKCLYESKSEKLYKGIIVDENKFDTFLKEFKKNELDNNTPKAIIFGETFFSFYTNEDIVNKLRKNKEKNSQYRYNNFITLILENANDCTFIKNHMHIKKDISCFEIDDEILFFPFSCFEIKKIEKNKNSNEYTIILNYLDKYTKLFNDDKSLLFQDIPKNDYTELIFKSGIIDYKLMDTPSWYDKPIKNETNKFLTNDTTTNDKSLNDNENNSNDINIFRVNNNMMNNNINNDNIGNNNMNNINNLFFNGNVTNSIGRTNQDYITYNNNCNYYNNNYNLNNFFRNQMLQYNIQNQNQYNFQPNFKIIRYINDYNLLNNVVNICTNSISQNNYNTYEELRDIIQNNLMNIYNGNWWININNQIINNYGDIDINSVMIIQYMNMFIHVAKLN